MVAAGRRSQRAELNREIASAGFVGLKKTRVVSEQESALTSLHVHQRLEQGGRLQPRRPRRFNVAQHSRLSLVLRNKRQHEQHRKSRQTDR